VHAVLAILVDLARTVSWLDLLMACLVVLWIVAFVEAISLSRLAARTAPRRTDAEPLAVWQRAALEESNGDSARADRRAAIDRATEASVAHRARAAGVDELQIEDLARWSERAR